MSRVLTRMLDQLAAVRVDGDRSLLDRFLADRDEAAFAEIVRRYGPLVWGACRRGLACQQDAEDAFQATFLVLLRRAGHLKSGTVLGPWLYRVATLTTRNVRRGNRRRAAISGPMEHDVPARDPESSLDLEAALRMLPERDRLPVILCHLQGLTRREAAEVLGCTEGTLSGRLHRALAELRARLGVHTVLAAGAVVVPAQLASATVRSATLSTLGVSPAVVGITKGVLRMFWIQKVATVVCFAALAIGAGAWTLGLAGRPEPAAHAAAPEEPDELKRADKKLAELQKQKEVLDNAVAEAAREKALIEARNKVRDSVASLGTDIVLEVDHGTYTLREVVAGKVGELTTTDLDVVAIYLSRAHRDPKGPGKLRLHIDRADEAEHKTKVFAACASAGYKQVLLTERLVMTVYISPPRISATPPPRYVQKVETSEMDLTKFGESKDR